jgi:hypothetical protein
MTWDVLEGGDARPLVTESNHILGRVGASGLGLSMCGRAATVSG